MIEELGQFDVLTQDIISKEFRQWLIDNGFFTAPASTKFHHAKEGGLFSHSLNVAKSLMTLTVNNKLHWQNSRSPILIGMFHDLCKIDQYIYNPETETYAWNPHQEILGHGDKSVKLLSKFVNLTPEEVDCITYHMGAFTNSKDEWPKFTHAIHLHSNVLWTHMADMIATHILEVDRPMSNNYETSIHVNNTSEHRKFLMGIEEDNK